MWKTIEGFSKYEIECMSLLLGGREPEPMSVEGIASVLKGEVVDE